MTTKYPCWTIVCPSANCGTVIYLDVIAPVDDIFKVALIPHCKDFVVTCPQKLILHIGILLETYQEKVLTNPPVGLYCQPFRDALLPPDVKTSSEIPQTPLYSIHGHGGRSLAAIKNPFRQRILCLTC